MEAHEPKYGVHKMVTPLRIDRGSSLNIGWSKCGIWLVDQWVPTSLCACVCLRLLIAHWEVLVSLSFMHAWLLNSFEALACRLYWLIISFFLTHWLFLLYDHSTHLGMYIILIAYLIHFDMIDSFGCILSWLSWSMLSFLDIHLDYHISCLSCV